jgi:hypothetical protein
MPIPRTALSDEDLAAAVAAADEFKKIRGGKAPKNSKEIFYAGFHFGVAHARGQVELSEPAPSPDEDVDGEG